MLVNKHFFKVNNQDSRGTLIDGFPLSLFFTLNMYFLTVTIVFIIEFWLVLAAETLHHLRCSSHVENSRLICMVNQLTCFYMTGWLVMNGLNKQPAMKIIGAFDKFSANLDRLNLIETIKKLNDIATKFFVYITKQPLHKPSSLFWWYNNKRKHCADYYINHRYFETSIPDASETHTINMINKWN